MKMTNTSYGSGYVCIFDPSREKEKITVYLPSSTQDVPTKCRNMMEHIMIVKVESVRKPAAMWERMHDKEVSSIRASCKDSKMAHKRAIERTASTPESTEFFYIFIFQEKLSSYVFFNFRKHLNSDGLQEVVFSNNDDDGSDADNKSAVLLFRVAIDGKVMDL